MIEMAVLDRGELDLPVVIKTGGDAAIVRNGFNNGKIAVGDSKQLVRSGELDAISD